MLINWKDYYILKISCNVVSLLMKVLCCHTTHKVVQGSEDSLAVAAQVLIIPSVISKSEEVGLTLLIHIP